MYYNLKEGSLIKRFAGLLGRNENRGGNGKISGKMRFMTKKGGWLCTNNSLDLRESDLIAVFLLLFHVREL
jgi:hypothetical protein